MIMECRQTRLSDHQCCLEHDINLGLLLTQVVFRKQVCEFPAPAERQVSGSSSGSRENGIIQTIRKQSVFSINLNNRKIINSRF